MVRVSPKMCYFCSLSCYSLPYLSSMASSHREECVGVGERSCSTPKLYLLENISEQKK